MSASVDFAALRAALPRRAIEGRTAAAVAIVVRADGAILFIRRPIRAGDRWSGDVAFPGGLAREGEDAADAARREAREEVSLELAPPIGRLRDRISVHPRRARPMRVRPFVFAAPKDPSLVPDPREVDEAFWFPLARLARLPIVPALRRVGRVPVLVPALELDGRTLWGLTLAMVRELRAIVRSVRSRSP